MEGLIESISEESELILGVALDEFAEVGLVESSIESIADRAKLDPGSVRALFVDKANLLRELLKEETSPMISAIALAVEEKGRRKGTVAKVAATLRSMAYGTSENSQIIRSMLS